MAQVEKEGKTRASSPPFTLPFVHPSMKARVHSCIYTFISHAFTYTHILPTSYILPCGRPPILGEFPGSQMGFPAVISFSGLYQFPLQWQYLNLHVPQTWWPLPDTCRDSTHRVYISLVWKTALCSRLLSHPCPRRISMGPTPGKAHRGPSQCSPIRCSRRHSFPSRPTSYCPHQPTAHTSPLGAQVSSALLWATELPLLPEWGEVFKLRELHEMSLSSHWYWGPEMPALIFEAFLLGFKVLLVMSFIVTYIHRWQNL